MEQSLDHTVAVLARTPVALDALLRGLPEAWTLQNEGDKTMTVFDVVGHLTWADRTNWIPRAKMILEFGETRAFEPFKRWGHLKESGGKQLEDLLDEFAGARAESLRELRAMNLQPADLQRRGGHPALGAATLSQLLAAWAVHDLTHLHQISRVMARQYREAVGPWSAYLGVLKCEGHSSPS